jgi:hypothetical protein
MPVTSTSPRRSMESCSSTSGSPSSSNFGFLEGMERSTARTAPSARNMFTRNRPKFGTEYAESTSRPSFSWVYMRSVRQRRAIASMSSLVITPRSPWGTRRP